jgi:undecaprenyl pyrophosphate synthase
MNQRRQNSGADDAEYPRTTRKITGKDLKWDEELRIQISTLVEILDENGIINKKEYQRIVSMRLHEISKALAFDEIDEEI